MDQLLKCIENVKNQAKNKAANESFAINTSSKVKPYPALLNQRTYPINKSKSKFATVGLCGYGPFGPAVVLHGQKNDWVLFEEWEWNLLAENEGVIKNYFEARDVQVQTVNLSNAKRITFTTIGPNKVILLQDQTGSEVYLGIESLEELWTLLPVIHYRVELLKNLEFAKFYGSIIKGVATLPGTVKENIENVLFGLNIATDNVLCMLEMLKFQEHIITCDIEIENIAQQLI